MNYSIELKKRAFKDLKALTIVDRKRVISGIEKLEKGIEGDVKRLTNHSPEFRLRVGNWRVLFEIEHDLIIVYRVLHRGEAYR